MASSFVSLGKGLVDDFEASQAATVRAEEEVKMKKGLVLMAKKSKTHAVGDVSSFRRRVVVPGRHAMQLLSKWLTPSSQMA